MNNLLKASASPEARLRGSFDDGQAFLPMAQVDHVIQMLWGIRTQDADCTMKWEVCDIYLFFFF